jgi:tetratricopeptide (TPR) repeat protein
MGLFDSFFSGKKDPGPVHPPPAGGTPPRHQAENLAAGALGQLELGRQLGNREYVAHARETADRALALDPDCRDALRCKVRALLLVPPEDNSHLPVALACCNRFLALDDRDPLMWYYQGMVLETMEQYQEALVAYNHTQSCIRGPAPGYLGVARGRVLEKLGREKDAEVSYTKVRPDDPACGSAGEAMAGLMERKGQPDNAVARYHAAAEAFHRRGDDDDALRCLDHVLRLVPYAPVALYRKSAIFLNQYNRTQEEGLLDKAEACLDAAPATDEKTAALILTSRGRCMIERNKSGEAVAFLDQALALSPANSEVHLHRGLAFQKLGRSDEALAAYDQARRRDIFNPLPWTMQAAIHRDQGKFEEGLKDIDESIRRNDKDPASWTIRAEILRGLGREAAATESEEMANRFKRGVYRGKDGIRIFPPGGGSIVVRGFGLTEDEE